MLGWWTIGRASGLGASAALVALLLWPMQRGHHDVLFWPLLAAAGLAGFCGASILLITAGDLLFHRRRGQRLRPVRVFDIVLATLLIALCLAQLDDLAGQLPG
jgi:hypothetical protein